MNESNIKSGIYAIRNIINNKVYIGSAKNLSKRKAQHFFTNGINSAHNEYLNRSFLKYGKENFIYEILCYVPNEKDLIHIESLYIKLFETYNPNIGYNMCISGRNRLGLKHKEETKKKISNATKGENNPRYGVVVSEETKQKIRNFAIGRKHSEESKRKIRLFGSVPIVQLTLDNKFVAYFQSAREAHRQTNIHYTNIIRACKGILKTAGKHKWVYAKDYNKQEG